MKLKISKTMEKMALAELKNFISGEIRKISGTDFFIAEPTNPKIKEGIVVGSVFYKKKEYFIIQLL